MRAQKAMKAVLLVAVLLAVQVAAQWFDPVVSSADFTGTVTNTAYASYNSVGVSMYYEEVLPYWNNSLYLSRMKLSMFSGFSSSFYQSIHVPQGYKYNCSSQIYGGNVSCLLDLATNTTLTSQINTFIYATAGWAACDVGYDMEMSNFASSLYMNNFKTYTNMFSRNGYNVELIDYSDQIQALYNRTYTAAHWMADLSLIYTAAWGFNVNGPGVTEAADGSWVDQIASLTEVYGWTFTFRCLLFKDPAQATIANLLHQNSSAVYLSKRLVDSTNKTLNMDDYYVGISEIRLTNDSGVHGVTNSFAAALWALDISVEFASMGGYFINFYNPLTPSNQSVFGAGPGFEPGAIFYGSLFAVMALRDGPRIQRVAVMAGTSGSVKVYSLNRYDYQYRILIINKDLSTNISGVVNVKHKYPSGFRCFYLSAPNLTSTSDITLAGMKFVANRTDYVGMFSTTDYFPGPSGAYSININYSQAVLCEQIPDPSYNKIPRGRSTQLAEQFLPFHAFLLVLLLLALQ